MVFRRNNLDSFIQGEKQMVITIKAMETAEEIEEKSRVHWQT